MAHRVEPLLDEVGDRGFAGTGKAGEPEDARLLILDRGVGVLVDLDRLPVDVLARRRAKWIKPAPTVPLVRRSIRMKPPVSRFSV